MTVDLTTQYLGLTLKNPLVASASPMTGVLEQALELEDAGVSAIVMPSLFEEAVEHEELEVAAAHDFGAHSSGEAMNGYLPDLQSYGVGSEVHLERVRAAKERMDIPVVASLNGTSGGGWLRYAKEFEQAGADALELNIYDLPLDPATDTAHIEDGYVALVKEVAASVAIPLAVKIGPYFASVGHMAKRFEEAGAKGLVMFNRFYQPDFDLEDMSVVSNVQLSTSADARLPLRWIAILSGKLGLSLAASSGVYYSEDVIKLLLAGADVTCMTSALLKNGTAWPATVLEGLVGWMTEREYESTDQLRGSMSHEHSPNPEGFERANYMKALQTYSTRS